VNTTESLKDVINRHHPEMIQKWLNSSSAFSVWDLPPNKHNPIPIFFRVPN
jgi:alpha-dioxygenase